jgi:hypothetical protein
MRLGFNFESSWRKNQVTDMQKKTSLDSDIAVMKSKKVFFVSNNEKRNQNESVV